MELNDYDYPVDDYEPRPKASQQVAAQKRRTTNNEGRATEDTPSTIPVRRYVPYIVGAAVLIVAILVTQRQFDRAPVPLAITPGPSTAAFLAASTAAPAPLSATPAAIRTIGAYAAPDGLLLGQIDETREITPVAHYGAGWVQADVSGSGLVWLRVSDVPDLALTGPDLAPVAQAGQGSTIDTSNRPNEWEPPAPHVAPTGQKPADDRAARYATAVARDKQTHGQKGP